MQNRGPLALDAPSARAPWAPTSDPADATWQPLFAGADARRIFTYARPDGARVDLFVAYYVHQRQGAEVIHSANTMTGAKPWERIGSGTIVATLDGAPVTLATLRARRADRQRLVWYWYWVDGRFTSSPYVAKLWEVKAKLLGGERRAAVVAIAADYQDTPGEAARILRDFLDHVGAIGPVLARTD
ncbi:MAG: EpsI family protein [Alphaproteobacteria bacterium]|nr:MAG: EpsI family protein [Alphaproteobacteria bacterium]